MIINQVNYRALKTVIKKRPFIISRSTAPGHGKYAGHWDGDVVSSWEHMRWTVPCIGLLIISPC